MTYTIAMPAPHTHLYHVQVAVRDVVGATFDLTLPSWTPGSYMIRDYARHVQQFSATDDTGRALAWRKVAKDSWRVELAGATVLRASYRVYAYELTVRTSHLDGTHGYFNGATVFMYAEGRTNEPLTLLVQPPAGIGWQVTTGLTPAPHLASDGQAAFVASDYDELIDCPVECGTHRLLTFAVDSKRHSIAIWGHGNEDEQRILADTQAIVQEQRDLFGGLPYEHYTFILHLATGYGGLEHRNSVTNLIDRWSFQPRKSYERFLELQSHEFFHVWNVKRIRPAPLGPFHYRSETYTRLLWAMEGVTSYYDRLLLVRAGLMSDQRYLETLADDIVTMQSTPGRALHSLEESSFDAWIKLYKADENTHNTSISYYLKGALAMLLLDLEIRQQTSGAYSFDDVLRYLCAHYPIDGPGIPEEGGYLAAIEAVAGEANGTFRRFFARSIAGTDELDYARGLGYVGLRLEWGYNQSGTEEQPPAWLGLQAREEHGKLKVSRVRSDGPAYIAGIYTNDELVALNGYRINEDRLNARLSEQRPGDTILLTLFRRDELLHVPVVLAAAPPDVLRLIPLDEPTTTQQRMYREWLGL
ncbi:MAG: M61 family metallopeptidase [Chloroflexaceae bacterium]|nr:M61 family metallopeptidase [Chloroflexaceae bacterium]